MLLSSFVLLILFIWAISRYVRNHRKQDSNLPPGPTPLPVLGNLHQVDWTQMHQTFDEWRKRYGDIVSAKFLDTQVIVLNSYDMVKEALIKQAENFAARKKLWVIMETTGGKPAGYINNDGWQWKEQRRFALHVLRDFGLGKALQEEKIGTEIQDLFIEFDKRIPNIGDSADLNVVMNIKFAVVNIINNILLGKRFEHGNPRFTDFATRIQESFANILFQLPMEFIPFLRNFKWLFRQAQVDENSIVMRNHLMTEINQHKETLAQDLANDGPSDFVYAYLKEMHERSTVDDQSMNTFSDHQLCYSLGDLFVAGFETTATTVSWFLVYMVHHPDIQQKGRNEIRKYIGTKNPTWNERYMLPYCSALVAEVQRYANIVPMGVFHSTFEDTTLKGYFIPKQSMVVINHWSIMRDEKLFNNATEFNPGRFLDDQGNFKDRQEGWIPFSLGKRSCIGEALARMELFLICTSLISRYNISAADSGPPSLDAQVTLTLAPKPFSVKLTRLQ